MPPVRDHRLTALAGVLVRVGVNLQPGQSLLITDPYDLLGVHPDCQPLVDAVRAAATGHEVVVLNADPAALRAVAVADDLRGYESLVRHHTRRLHRHLDAGGAFLFLTGSAPQLLAGLPAERLARFDTAKWRAFGPLIQQLIAGASQCCLAPAPASPWAEQAGVSLATVWDWVYAALRVGESDTDPIAACTERLAALDARCAELNARRPRRIRYVGPSTDLALDIPRSHRWCTTRLRTEAGIPFVFNLPTEEVFSAPHRTSARGTLRAARPIAHGGTVISGIELEFADGAVTAARAETGADLLRELLATDAGAGRVGEIAMIPEPAVLGHDGRLFHHILLDENASHHIALGCAYRFCSRAWYPLALNQSQIHVDLPLKATVEIS